MEFIKQVVDQWYDGLITEDEAKSKIERLLFPTFDAKIEDSIIWVWAVGKWRGIRHYSPKNTTPSDKIQKDVLHSIWLNCGKSFDLDKAKLNWIKS